MMKKTMIEKLKNTFSEKYEGRPFVVRSPGRVNLIGEHTDYNGGFVLPASIDKAIYFIISPNEDNLFRFYSYDLQDNYETSIDAIAASDKHWANYLLGVIAQFVKEDHSVRGFDCVFGGDVPIGAGMSSSAAIECGLAFAINEMGKYGYSPLELVKFSQLAEHEYAGVQCGILDQFAVMHGQKNHVIKLDTRSLQYELFPLDMSDYLLILVNTGVKHSLAASAYNKRRQECEAGVHIMQQYDKNISSLRDVTLSLITQHKEEMSDAVYNRCTYVIEENLRVESACEALEKLDFKKFGELMYGSHYGLKEKYEVSCQELDHLVNIAEKAEGVVGARMMGGGFGGCTINLVKKEAVPNFRQTVIDNYQTPDGSPPEIIEVVIEDGTNIIN